MENYKVYKHTFPNGKFYIGITSKKNVKERWGENGKYYKSQFVYRAIQKYGWENIRHDILFENLTKEQAEQKEIELIAFYKSTNEKFGYNIENGGNTQGKMSEITRNKISKALKNYNKLYGKNKKTFLQTEEAKKKRKKSLIEYYKNHTVSKETREKISKSVKGKTAHIWTEEEKEKQRQRLKGRIFTEEWKNKISEAKKGSGNAMFGKKHSEEHKRKIAESVMKNSKKKKVFCLENNTTYISLSECGRQLGIPTNKICQVCKGKRKSVNNYHFIYIE